MRERDGALVHLTVKAGAKAPGIAWQGEGWVLRVRERAIDGAANEACIQALAQVLRVAPSRITLLRGHRARRKTFAIAGLDENAVRERMVTQS